MCGGERRGTCLLAEAAGIFMMQLLDQTWWVSPRQQLSPHPGVCSLTPHPPGLWRKSGEQKQRSSWVEIKTV